MMFQTRSERRGHEMNAWLRELSLTYAAGAEGALINSLVVWLFGLLGITTAVGVNLAPALDPRTALFSNCLERCVRLAVSDSASSCSHFLRGLVFSIPPTVAQLFAIFRFKAGKGIMGLDL